MDNFLRKIDAAAEFVGGLLHLGSLIFLTYAIYIVAR